MEPAPLHRQTIVQLKASVEGLGWGGVRPVSRQLATDTEAFASHYASFRAEPLVLQGATAAWPLSQEKRRSDGILGALACWLDATPVETLTLHYSDTTKAAEGDDLTFDAAQRDLRVTTFGEFIRRSRADDNRGKESRTACATNKIAGVDMEYLQKLRVPRPESIENRCHTQHSCSGLQRLAASLSWPTVPCMAAAAAETMQPSCSAEASRPVERETNLWAGCCLTSQLHFDGLDNIHSVVSGSKLFLLFSPWETERLYPTPRRDGALNNTSEIGSVLCLQRQRKNNGASSASKFAETQKAHCMLVIVDEGDGIYIPNGWWHEVFTPTFAVSVNTW